MFWAAVTTTTTFILAVCESGISNVLSSFFSLAVSATTFASWKKTNTIPKFLVVRISSSPSIFRRRNVSTQMTTSREKVLTFWPEREIYVTLLSNIPWTTSLLVDIPASSKFLIQFFRQFSLMRACSYTEDVPSSNRT